MQIGFQLPDGISTPAMRCTFYEGKNDYALNNQKSRARFAAQKVEAIGVLDLKAKILRV